MDITFTSRFGHQEQEKSCSWRKNLVIRKTCMQLLEESNRRIVFLKFASDEAAG